MNLTAGLLPGQPQERDAPVFREPWEAQAFAMVVALRQRDCFGWPEWTRILAAEIAAAGTADEADVERAYYLHWVTALEKLLVAKGVTSNEELAIYERAWANAARRTPHGQPLELQQIDFRS